jgi:hypothetical protein
MMQALSPIFKLGAYCKTMTSPTSSICALGVIGYQDFLLHYFQLPHSLEDSPMFQTTGW